MTGKNPAGPIKAAVDGNRCLKCGGCISVCRFNAIDMPHSNIVIDKGLCTGCRVCFAACPVSALSATKRAERAV